MTDPTSGIRSNGHLENAVKENLIKGHDTVDDVDNNLRGITANGTVVNGNDGGNILCKENKKRSSGGLSCSPSLSPMAAKMHPKIHSNGNTQSLSVLIENNNNGQNDHVVEKNSEKGKYAMSRNVVS